MPLAGGLSDHLGVVTLHAAGKTATGAGYIVMEYMPGGSVGRLLRDRGPLSVPQAAAVRGRSLMWWRRRTTSESSIVTSSRRISSCRRAGDAKLGDFGISALISSATSGMTSGQAYTPDHVAPEVLHGEAADRKSDVYSLTSSLYQLLTGQPPYRSSPEEPLATMLMRKVSEPPQPLPPAVPAGLASLVLAGLDRDPNGRPTTRELAAGLAALPMAPLWAPGDEPRL